jgi:DNA-binding XRE family transcriptional regulator
MPRQSFTGSRPDYERRREMIALRAQGLTFSAIGRRLNVSRQSVHQVVARCKESSSGVGPHCRECGTEITQRPGLAPNTRRVLCRVCLAGRPATSLGQRLKAYRVTAGLTQIELSEQVGVHLQTLASYEQDARRPLWPTLTKLARALGLEVLDLWNERARDTELRRERRRP